MKFNENKRCDKIIKLVNDYYKVNCLEKSRKREIVLPRQVAQYFCYNETILSLTEVGKVFSKDHATILHATKVVESLLSYDKNFINQINFLRLAVEKTDEANGRKGIKLSKIKRISETLNKFNIDKLNKFESYLYYTL